MPTQSLLFEKYDVPTPRYTSYPTVPTWDASSFTSGQWFDRVKRSFNESNDAKGISLYVHLPFCESLCTYCACNTRITVNHHVEIPYIRSLLKEWEHYRNLFGRKPLIRALHLGGGTPTFFSAKNLHWLVSYILEDVDLHEDFEMSFEGHPNNTTDDHLKVLFDLGCRRLSLGVQDLDEKVQQTIHRIQPLENLDRVTRAARSIGYKSVSYDLIYGLPHQTPFTVSDTVDKILALRPDRVAFYSYAHVPWLRPGQRGYSEHDLPSKYLKRHLYDIGKHKLTQHGYACIGMDHFALTTDDLFKAHVAGTLYRNFMGYTTSESDLLIGLGASAISDARYAYAQNSKDVQSYSVAVAEKSNAISKGHLLSEEDLLVRTCILQICCNGHLDAELLERVSDEDIALRLSEMEEEGLIHLSSSGLRVRPKGEPFIRNICQVMDKRMPLVSEQRTFSNSI